MFALMILSTLIFSLLTIIYHKLTESINLRCVSPLLLYRTRSIIILIKLLLISFQLNKIIASPNKVITSQINSKVILDLELNYWLKNCAVGIVINLALMMLLKQHIINNPQMPVALFLTIINIWKRNH